MNPAFDVLGIGLNATDTLILVEEFPAYAGKVPFGRELLSPGGQVATAGRLNQLQGQQGHNRVTQHPEVSGSVATASRISIFFIFSVS